MHLQSLRKHLLDELEQAFPDEVESYREIRAASAAVSCIGPPVWCKWILSNLIVCIFVIGFYFGQNYVKSSLHLVMPSPILFCSLSLLNTPFLIVYTCVNESLTYLWLCSRQRLAFARFDKTIYYLPGSVKQVLVLYATLFWYRKQNGLHKHKAHCLMEMWRSNLSFKCIHQCHICSLKDMKPNDFGHTS